MNRKLATFLFRRLAAEQEHPVARRVEFIERVLEQALLQSRIFADKALEGGIGEGADLDIGRGFRGIGIALAVGAAGHRVVRDASSSWRSPALTFLPVRWSMTPAASGTMVMQPSTGQTLTHRLQPTHSSSITSKWRLPSFIA
jgi:hypothetical protein